MFFADDRWSDEGEVVVTANLVVLLVFNVALLASRCHDESESGCLTRDKYFRGVACQVPRVKMFWMPMRGDLIGAGGNWNRGADVVMVPGSWLS